MKSGWVPNVILRAASLLAPREHRAEWVREWQSELWYVPRRGSTRFCLGAFRDALWIRRERPRAAERSGMYLESPLHCLTFLSVLASAGLAMAAWLPAPRLAGMPAHFRLRDLPAACMAMALLSGLMLPALRMVMGPHHHAMPRPGKLRRGVFLALKLALVHPIILCGFLIQNRLAPVAPITNLIVTGAWIWALRWILLDQRQRCPVCLRLLTDSVRIGTASQTLFEWYGAESVCSRGHGLLHSAESSASYSSEPQWLRLDPSWDSLFVESAKERR